MTTTATRDQTLERATQPLLDGMARFEPIGLDAAIKLDLMSRIDTKVVLPVERLVELLDGLSRATERIEGQAPYRVVETPTGITPAYATLYFDTPDLKLYRDHHNQRRIRHKIRYRHYHSTDATFFEVKQRTSSRQTTKTRVAVPAVPLTIGSAEVSLARRCDVDVTGLRPTIHIAYRRVTLLAEDHRVTIDLGLRCEARNQQHTSLTDMAILEIKQARRNPYSPVSMALRDLGLRPHSISKYCIGIAGCFSQVKRNRFEPRLRQLGLA